MNTELRICDHKSTFEKKYFSNLFAAVESVSRARTLISEFQEPSSSFNFRLLRISSMGHTNLSETKCLEAYFQQVNLRYIYFTTSWISFSGFPSSVSLLWNLQTIIVHHVLADVVKAPSEIWEMRRLRHVQIKLLGLPNPPNDEIVLENLQTLSCIYSFRCGEEVVKRIPNIKKLKIYHDDFEEGSPSYGLNNLGHLHKLESLHIKFYPEDMSSHLVQSLTFPHSLKKLTLFGTQIRWEDLTTKTGSLPHLEVLKLQMYSCIGHVWETFEGQFCSLKYLLIEQLHDLEYWITDNTHFPRLEQLILTDLYGLKEIPSSIGDIPTLQLIQLETCSDSASDSAKAIQREQEEYENVGLKVQVRTAWD